jgi:hypothetical protein
LRPTIENSGDAKAVADYNAAVRTVKARMRTNTKIVSDATRRSQVSGVDFFDAARAFHRNPVSEVASSNADQHAQDSAHEEDWFAAHREAGRRMRKQ